jgi:hypothetical protein
MSNTKSQNKEAQWITKVGENKRNPESTHKTNKNHSITSRFIISKIQKIKDKKSWKIQEFKKLYITNGGEKLYLILPQKTHMLWVWSEIKW